MRKNTKKPDVGAQANAKKKLLIIVSVIACVLAILICISFIIDSIENKSSNTYEIDYNFYDADYDEDIFQDNEYLALIEGEFMRYSDSSTGLTLGIDRESAKEQGTEVAFLVELLYSAIEGDAQKYNACFSEAYYKNNSPKDRFTMQKIYDVTITFISTEKVSDETGNYTKSIYSLEYKIYHNNGTFRRDIGDGSKKQYLTITDSTGSMLVDHLTTVNVH